MHTYVLHGPNALIRYFSQADLQGGLGICSPCSLVQPGLGHIPNISAEKEAKAMCILDASQPVYSLL